VTVSKNNSASEKANVIKSIFKKMKAKANIKKESDMLVDILKKAE
jgi:hypothetical protein